MRRLLAAIALVLAAPVAAAPGAAAVTSLRITFWPEGKSAGVVRSWTLRCLPAGGTLPDAARACRRLATLADPFAPVPPDTACSQIYSGPELSLVAGTFRGRRVWTYFKRTDGCQTARWSRVAFLFPPG